MSIETLRTFLLWSTIINYGLITLWFLLFIALRGPIFRLHSTWFSLSEERFSTLMYQGMMFYKIGVMLFNLAPLIALYIIK
jgi:hypothetical protein